MRAFVAATMQKFALQEKGCQRGGSMANRLGGPDRARPGASGAAPPRRFCQGGLAACPIPAPTTIVPSFGPRPAALGARTLVRARCIPAIGCLGPAQRVVARERAPP